MTLLSAVQFSLLLGILSGAVVTDLRERRIPNRLTMMGLLAGIITGALAEGGFPTAALGGAGLALLVAFPLVALGGLGAGDAKLLTAVGAFVGPGGLLSVLVYGGLAGGVLAIANSVRRGAFLGVLVNMKNLLVNWATMGRRGQKISLNSPGAQSIPYALAIAAGAAVTWFFPFSVGGLL